MKIILYSTDNYGLNRQLDKKLFRMLGKASPTMVYIPTTVTEPKSFFNEWTAHYRKFGVTDFIYFPLKKPIQRDLSKKVFNADVIYLSGGNTYAFLANLKKSRLHSAFKSFVKKGGVLTGCSAGAILMTPNIHMAAVPSLDKDPRTVKLDDLKALQIVDFEFSPHYVRCPKSDQELLTYSLTNGRPIFGVTDGSGIIVSEGKLQFVGSVFRFQNGKKNRVRKNNISFPVSM